MMSLSIKSKINFSSLRKEDIAPINCYQLLSVYPLLFSFLFFIFAFVPFPFPLRKSRSENFPADG